MNVWDIVILILLAAAVAGALLYIKKRGGSCDCGCESCPHTESCHKKKSAPTKSAEGEKKP